VQPVGHTKVTPPYSMGCLAVNSTFKSALLLKLAETLQDAKITAYGLRGNRRVEVASDNVGDSVPSFSPRGEWNPQPLQITFTLDFNTDWDCCGHQKINVVYFHVCANVPE
jgi:hypothetical protein